jgi:hypothetical protein
MAIAHWWYSTSNSFSRMPRVEIPDDHLDDVVVPGVVISASIELHGLDGDAHAGIRVGTKSTSSSASRMSKVECRESKMHLAQPGSRTGCSATMFDAPTVQVPLVHWTLVLSTSRRAPHRDNQPPSQAWVRIGLPTKTTAPHGRRYMQKSTRHKQITHESCTMDHGCARMCERTKHLIGSVRHVRSGMSALTTPAQTVTAT